jgi:Zn ribbon nucleic-acid-binding protein
MSQEIIRCPYCVLGSEFQPMVRRSENIFACVNCGHISSPEDPSLRCSCSRCRQMNRVANRITASGQTWHRP